MWSKMIPKKLIVLQHLLTAVKRTFSATIDVAGNEDAYSR